MEKGRALMENINPIIYSERGITISSGDCSDFKEFLEQELTSTAIMQQLKEVLKSKFIADEEDDDEITNEVLPDIQALSMAVQ